MNLLLSFGFVFIIHISNVFSLTTVKPCKNPGAVSVVTDIKGCETPPCVVSKGTNMLSEITFTADKDYEKLHVSLFGELGGMKRGFPGKDGKDACPFLYTNPGKVKAGCPVKAGVEYVYDNPLFIEKFFLSITVTTYWGLRDKKSKTDLFCFELPVKIAG